MHNCIGAPVLFLLLNSSLHLTLINGYPCPGTILATPALCLLCLCSLTICGHLVQRRREGDHLATHGPSLGLF